MTLLAKLYEAVESAEWTQSRLETLEVDNTNLCAKFKVLEEVCRELSRLPEDYSIEYVRVISSQALGRSYAI